MSQNFVLHYYLYISTYSVFCFIPSIYYLMALILVNTFFFVHIFEYIVYIIFIILIFNFELVIVNSLSPTQAKLKGDRSIMNCNLIISIFNMFILIEKKIIVMNIE